jgi:hypothetical protein
VPRTSQGSTAPTRGRRRAAGSTVDSRSVVGQISQLVTANEELQRENRELAADNVRLKAQLREIGDALGRLTGAPKRGRGRSGAAMTPEPVRRPRKPITDPAVLEKKKQALTKARAARAEKLAAARAAAEEANAAG